MIITENENLYCFMMFIQHLHVLKVSVVAVSFALFNSKKKGGKAWLLVRFVTLILDIVALLVIYSYAIGTLRVMCR